MMGGLREIRGRWLAGAGRRRQPLVPKVERLTLT